MTIYRTPGTYTKTTDLSTYVKNLSTNITGMLGVTEKGPINIPTLITTWEQFVKVFGGYNIDSDFPHYVKSFFDNGGANVYINSIAHYTDIMDSTTLTAVSANKELNQMKLGNNQTNVGLIKVSAKNEKTWGNDINFSTNKLENILTTEILATGANSVVLNSIRNISVGDKIIISDSVNKVSMIVTSLDSTTKTIYFKSITLATSISSGATVKSSSNHNLTTSLKTGTSISSNATEVELSSADGIEVGTIVTFIDKRTSNPYSVSVKVTKTNGKKIYFDSIGTITSILAVNSKVVTQEFNLSVKYKSTLVERYENLAIYVGNSDYFVDRVNNTSEYIVLEDLDIDFDPIDLLPDAVEDILLEGADDGLTGLASSDYIGDEVSKLGLHAFDIIENLDILLIPGNTDTTVLQALGDYIATRPYTFYIIDAPNNLTPQEVVDFKKGQGEYTHIPFSSTDVAMYYPWGKIIDPVTGAKKSLGMSAAMAGIYAKNDQVADVWYAPAGLKRAVLTGFSDLEYYMNDIENGIIFDEGINAIRLFEEGITCWGDRTLVNYGTLLRDIAISRTLKFISKSIKYSTRRETFDPNDPTLWRAIVRTVNPFLRRIKDKRGLIDYFIKCDASTNTSDLIEQGICLTKVGLKPTPSAKFIVFDLVVTKLDVNFKEII